MFEFLTVCVRFIRQILVAFKVLPKANNGNKANKKAVKTNEDNKE